MYATIDTVYREIFMLKIIREKIFMVLNLCGFVRSVKFFLMVDDYTDMDECLESS